jgi:multidrug efflux pump subunit AcrB
MKGLSNYQAALQGTNAVALPVLASTLTTMAVLLPVVLFAGLAKRLFVPLALTVAVAMTASYFVSVCVTPVACRYFLGHGHPGGFAARVGRMIERLAERYSEILRVVLPYRRTILVASALLVIASAFAALYLPSTFFPEIDESMEQVYVRFAPGTSLQDSARQIQAMGEVLRKELPPGAVELVLTNIGSPSNARSAMNSPNNGPHMGFIRLQLVDPEKRKLSQGELSDRIRDILNAHYPGVDFLEEPGGLVASVFSNGYIAPLVVEVRGENLAELDRQAKAVAEVARTVPGIRDIYPSLEMDYPEIHVDLDRQQAGMVDVTARDAAQASLEATLGNINTPSVWVDAANGQSYYVVTYYDGKYIPDVSGLERVPVRVGKRAAAVTLGAYGDVRRAVGPVAVERNQLERAAHVMMQTEGRDIGSAAEELQRKLEHDPRTKNVKFSFVGQVDLMRTTFSGLGLAIGLAVMVVFMIMASQFKSLRLPFVMLFTIPGTLIGIVLALMAAGQGFSVTALMGILMVVGIAVSNGILLVDHANKRFNEGLSAVDAVVDAARTRFVPIVMTSLATVIGLIPTAMALEKGSEANRPLALAVVGGLTSSTFLSLFLVPVMFLYFARRESVPAAEQHVPAHPAPTHA